MDRKIRILQVITTTIGGAGEHVLLLSRGLDKNKFDVSVAFSPGMPLDKKFYEGDFRVYKTTMSRGINPIIAIRGLLTLTNILRAEQFDIVHTHTSFAGFIGRLAARMSRVPVVIHMVHAYAAHDYVHPLKKAVYLRVEKILDRLTDFYIAGSEAIRQKGIITGIMSEDKIECIYYAMDIEEFDRNLAEDSSNIRVELDISPETPLVGTVGRFEQQKGLVYLLEAAAQIARLRPEVRYLFVGDGPLRRKLEDLARTLGIREKVIFLGWRKDIPQIMQAMDLLAVPSLWEAFGIVNIEAMAARVPIVATNVEGIPEVVEDGQTGYLVPARDPETLANAILSILDDTDLRRKMGDAGRKRVEKKFTARRMVKEHESLYFRLLKDLEPKV